MEDTFPYMRMLMNHVVPFAQPDLPTQESVRRALRESAKEAVQAICDAWPDGFEVLLHRDKLRDAYGSEALDYAFDEILDERRRR